MFSPANIFDFNEPTTYKKDGRKIKVIIKNDYLEHIYKNKVVYRRLAIKDVCGLKLKHSSTLNSKRFYNLIIKLDQRISALESKLQELKFNAEIKYNDYVVYDIGDMRNYYIKSERTKSVLVKTHKSSQNYVGNETFWTCPYHQVFNYEYGELNERYKGLFAFFTKIADQDEEEAAHIATKVLDKEIKKELSALKKKNDKQAKKAFIIENNIIFYRTNLNKIIDAYVKLFITPGHNFRSPAKSIYFPEIKKCIVINRQVNNYNLIDVVVGSDL